MADYDLVARTNALARRIEQLNRPQPLADRVALEAAQVRADSVARQFGEHASQPVPGETPLAYRKRLLAAFQGRSERFRDARLDSLDASNIGPIEDLIFADAAAAARNPASHTPGTLTAVTTFEGGRDITRFHGDPMSWMAPFISDGVSGSFNRNVK